MADENMAARFAGTIRDLLAPTRVVPTCYENVDPEIRRVERAIARLPKRTREVFIADSDDRAHVFRSDAAQRSDLIARSWSA